MSIPSAEMMRAFGRRLAEQGLYSVQLVSDLDETIWDWSMSLALQPLGPLGHYEWIHVRRRLTALLRGIVDGSNGAPIRVWTAGYGYRTDRVCDRVPLLGETIHAGLKHPRLEQSAHACTRLGFLQALSSSKELRFKSSNLAVSSKLPGAPAAANRPLVDAACILLDDRRENCELFVAEGPERMAVHLAGAQRKWSSSIQVGRAWTPEPKTWAPSIAQALQAFIDGKRGVVEAHAVSCQDAYDSVRVFMPHHIAYREWIGPGRRIRRLLNSP